MILMRYVVAAEHPATGTIEANAPGKFGFMVVDTEARIVDPYGEASDVYGHAVIAHAYSYTYAKKITDALNTSES